MKHKVLQTKTGSFTKYIDFHIYKENSYCKLRLAITFVVFEMYDNISHNFSLEPPCLR